MTSDLRPQTSSPRPPADVFRGLHVCFIAGTLGPGGAERQLFYMLRALHAAGASLEVLSLTQGEFWEEPIRALGVPVIWVGRRPSRLARLCRITREIARNRPDVIQSSHFYTNLYTVVAGRLLGLRDVGAVRADVFNEIKAHNPLLGRLCLGSPRWLAANSQLGLRNAAAKGVNPSRCYFLPNVVDTEHFKPAVRQQKGATHLLFAGRLVEQKRPDLFLHVLAEARRMSPTTVHGVIVGDGPLLRPLQVRASQLGLLPDGVEFRGAVPDMAGVYRDADIFLLTSDWEGTPNVVLEASASGLPVVVTRATGTVDIVRDGQTGYVLDRNDQHGITSAIVRLARDSELRYRLGKEGRLFVMQNHSLANLSERLSALYIGVLS